MGRMVHDVFLASPFEEFKVLRKLLNIEINKLASRSPIALVDLNDGAVTHSPPIEECIEKASRSDFMILLMGDTYGSYVGNENKSYTHLEYESVIYENSPTAVLVYCIGDSYRDNKIEYSNNENFRQFQKIVKDRHTIGFYSKNHSIEEIKNKIITDLLISISSRSVKGHMVENPVIFESPYLNEKKNISRDTQKKSTHHQEIHDSKESITVQPDLQLSTEDTFLKKFLIKVQDMLIDLIVIVIVIVIGITGWFFMQQSDSHDKGIEENLNQQNIEKFENNREDKRTKYYKNKEEACSNGELKECANLGVIYVKGKGVSQDYLKAMELFDKACNGGITKGCYNLGIMYVSGKGISKNYFKAVDFFKKACENNDDAGCNNLGYMYEKGQGTKQNDVNATLFYKKACDLGNSEGCNNLGYMYKNGRGTDLHQ